MKRCSLKEEAGGRSLEEAEHAARFSGGKLVLQGCKTWILQNKDGKIYSHIRFQLDLITAIGLVLRFYKDQEESSMVVPVMNKHEKAFKSSASEEGILPVPKYHMVLHTHERLPEWALINTTTYAGDMTL